MVGAVAFRDGDSRLSAVGSFLRSPCLFGRLSFLRSASVFSLTVFGPSAWCRCLKLGNMLLWWVPFAIAVALVGVISFALPTTPSHVLSPLRSIWSSISRCSGSSRPPLWSSEVLKDAGGVVFVLSRRLGGRPRSTPVVMGVSGGITDLSRRLWMVLVWFVWFGLGFSPELGPVVYCIFFTGVGSSCCVISGFLSAGVGSGCSICMLYFSTGVGHVEIAIYWVRSSRLTGHCSSLGSHPPSAQSSVLQWPCLYLRFCEVCGCERHLFYHSSETVGPQHLTSFDLSIKIGRFLVARSCVIIWRFMDPLRSFGSRSGLWSWIPITYVTRPVCGLFL